MAHASVAATAVASLAMTVSPLKEQARLHPQPAYALGVFRSASLKSDGRRGAFWAEDGYYGAPLEECAPLVEHARATARLIGVVERLETRGYGTAPVATLTDGKFQVTKLEMIPSSCRVDNSSDDNQT